MDYIREKVSGKKNRLKQGNFNLDLTYITERIIAMSMPGEGFEGIYRNPIDQVAQYSQEEKKKYLNQVIKSFFVQINQIQKKK